jgi:hypothetical protein
LVSAFPDAFCWTRTVLSATAFAQEMGAAQVIVVDKLPEQLELSTAFGAGSGEDLSALLDRERLAFSSNAVNAMWDML